MLDGMSDGMFEGTLDGVLDILGTVLRSSERFIDAASAVVVNSARPEPHLSISLFSTEKPSAP